MGDLYDKIQEVEAEIEEWKSHPDFYPWDGNYQRKLELLSELKEQYNAEQNQDL